MQGVTCSDGSTPVYYTAADAVRCIIIWSTNVHKQARLVTLEVMLDPLLLSLPGVHILSSRAECHVVQSVFVSP